MEKDLKIAELFEVYGELLTDKQRELVSAYYIYDLSLAEISEDAGTTRQSVFDGIKKAKAQLLEYEKVLKLYEKNSKLKRLSAEIEDVNPSLAEQINLIIGK